MRDRPLAQSGIYEPTIEPLSSPTEEVFANLFSQWMSPLIKVISIIALSPSLRVIREKPCQILISKLPPTHDTTAAYHLISKSSYHLCGYRPVIATTNTLQANIMVAVAEQAETLRLVGVSQELRNKPIRLGVYSLNSAHIFRGSSLICPSLFGHRMNGIHSNRTNLASQVGFPLKSTSKSTVRSAVSFVPRVNEFYKGPKA